MEKVEVVNQKSALGLVAKIIAIVVFSLTFAALFGAVISDIIILAQTIIAFITACILSALTFVFALILCFLSIVLVFGVFILDNYGFWPATWAKNIFHDIMNEHMLTSTQIEALKIIRIILIIVCFICLAGAIVGLSLGSNAKKQGYTCKLIKPFGVVSIVFSSLGLVVGAGALFIILLL